MLGMTVPNQFPTDAPLNRRLAIIGEAPATEEVSWRQCIRGHGYAGRTWREGHLCDQSQCPECGSVGWSATPTPMVGPSGRLLNWLLAQAGLPRSRVFVGNVAQEPLTTDDLKPEAGHPAVAAGLSALQSDLARFQPHCVLLLGNTALRAFHARGDASVTNWRGSVFPTREGVSMMKAFYKCIATYHPAAVLRQPEWRPLLDFDLRRAVAESDDPALHLPERRVIWNATANEIVVRLIAIQQARQPVSHDIEGYAHSGVTDFSFATSPTQALWVPLRQLDGSPWWPPHDEETILAATRGVLEDAAVPKVMHNATYEGFVWKWAHGITLRGIAGDTMLKFHELYCELEKNLSTAASLLTRQPYWGEAGDAKTEEERAIYNCIDSMVTLEIDAAIDALPATDFTPAQRAHYEHRVRLLEPCLWQMLHGIPFDVAARSELLRQRAGEIDVLQGELDMLAGIAPPSFREVVEAVCHKRKWDKCVDWPDVEEHANKRWRGEVAP